MNGYEGEARRWAVAVQTQIVRMVEIRAPISNDELSQDEWDAASRWSDDAHFLLIAAHQLGTFAAKAGILSDADGVDWGYVTHL